jgi:hypothetical protein
MSDSENQESDVLARSGFRQKMVSWVAALTLPVIALGNFSEAVMIVEDATDQPYRPLPIFPNIKTSVT